MGWKKGNPGCGCCEPCIPIDEFATAIEVDQANSTTIRSPAHPSSPYAMWLTLEIKIEAGATGRIFWVWDSATPGDGLYLEIEPDTPTATSGTIRLYRKDGTEFGDPWLVDGLVSDEWHVFTICLDPDDNETLICVDPAGAYQSQCTTILLPDDFVIGRKAGYGTGPGSGSVFIQNYSFERMYDGQEVCNTCTLCPAGPSSTNSSHWNVISGTWTFAGAGATTTSSNARAISYPGQARWSSTNGAAISLAIGDQAIIGMSDELGRNQVYIRVSKAGGSQSIPVGFYYDEDYSRFYWWIARVANFNVTYSIFRVTDGGAPVEEVGPTTVTPTVIGGSIYVVLADGYVTLHARMRKFLIGTDDNTPTGSVVIGGPRNQCACGGGVPAVPRKFDAVVAGLSAGSTPIYAPSTYVDPARLNRTVTLRNYYHLEPGSPYAAPCANCCHSNWLLDTGSQLTWFKGVYSGGNTELYGYAYTQQSTPVGLVAVQALFRKTITGEVDLRDLDGEELAYDSCIPANTVNGSGATFTVTSVP